MSEVGIIDAAAPLRDQEDQMFDALPDLLEKSANESPKAEDFAPDDPSRLEEPPPVEEVKAAQEEDEEEDPHIDSQWGPRPTIKDQISRQPDSVRAEDPRTQVFDLSKAEDLDEYNRIQKAAAGESPTLSITEQERQHYEGNWSVFVTYYTLVYAQL